MRSLVRTAFRALEPLAPELAARWATRLWCTPPHAARGRRRDPVIAPGERFLVPVTPRGMVAAEAWGTGPVTYLLHGWGGRRGQLGPLVAPLVAAGQRVVALDAPSHGESGPGELGGRRTTLLEFADALAAVVAVTGPAHAVVAHSGGGGATALAVRDGLNAGRLVFIAPMARPMSYLSWFAAELCLGRRSTARLIRRLERMVGRDLADLDAVAWADGAEPNRLPPLLVVHDRDDREVGYEHGQALAEAWPGAELLTTRGLGHRRILADPAVIEATVSFVAGPAGVAGPTGAASGVGSLTAATAAGSSPSS